MRRIVSYTLLLACLSGASFAGDRPDTNTSYGYEAVQGQNSINSQAKAIRYLTKQLKDMEHKNWDLAETINDLRSNNGIGAGSERHDPNIIGLIEENKRLSALVSGGYLQKSKAKNQGLVGKINRLKIKNKELSASLEKSLEFSRQQSDVYVHRKNKLLKIDNEAQQLSAVMTRLNKLQRENTALKDKLSNNNHSKFSNDAMNTELSALKSQNKSLGETIRAQNISLISADNAAQTADRLLTENLILQRSLDKLKQDQLYNGNSAKNLFELNQNLQSEILKRDNYINKMLMADNRAIKQSNKTVPNNALPVIQSQVNGFSDNRNRDALFDRNKRLENDLLTERAATVSYRKKISEYQNEIKKLNAGRSSE